jgi:hypothetical protein
MRGLVIEEKSLRKLLYKLKQAKQINNFAAQYSKSLYYLLGELNINARWKSKERGDSYAKFL